MWSWWYLPRCCPGTPVSEEFFWFAIREDGFKAGFRKNKQDEKRLGEGCSKLPMAPAIHLGDD